MGRRKIDRRGFLEKSVKGIAGAGLALLGAEALGGCGTLGDLRNKEEHKANIQRAREEFIKKDIEMARESGYQVYDVGRMDFEVHSSDGITLPTIVYYPKDKIQPSNVIIYSHGFFMGGESSRQLHEAWARRGNVVIACDHNDWFIVDRIGNADFNIDPAVFFNKLRRSIVGDLRRGKIPKENDLAQELFGYRQNEIDIMREFAFQLNEYDEILRKRLNPGKMVISGLSVGGKDSIIKVRDTKHYALALANSPATQWISDEDMANLDIPVFMVSGSNDNIGWFIRSSYEEMRSESGYMCLKNFHHFGVALDGWYNYGEGLRVLRRGRRNIDKPILSGEVPASVRADYKRPSMRGLSLGVGDAVKVFLNYRANLEACVNNALLVNKATSAVMSHVVDKDPSAYQRLVEVASCYEHVDQMEWLGEDLVEKVKEMRERERQMLKK
ncbi:MAG: hypothetical protein V1740_01745 [Candidatus Woesearchaeota archaeon]